MIVHVTFLILQPFIVASESYYDTVRLKADLFNNTQYDTQVRPVIDQSTTISVNLSLEIIAFIELDEHEEKLSTSVQLGITWHDELLEWQSDLYNGTTDLIVSKNDVWKPDIILKNRVNEFEEFGNGIDNVIIYSSGRIVWNLIHIMHSHCTINFYSFPFDKHTCNIKFGSLTLKADDLVISLDTRPKFDQTDFGSWSVQSVDSVVETEDYSILTVTIRLERIVRPYIISAVMPISLLVVLNLITFFIPALIGERMSYSVTLFLAFQIFLSLFDTQFPHGVDARLKDFLFIELYLSGISIILSISSMRTGNRKDKVSDALIQKVRSYRNLKSKLHATVVPFFDSKYQNPQEIKENISSEESTEDYQRKTLSPKESKKDNKYENESIVESFNRINNSTGNENMESSSQVGPHIVIDDTKTGEEKEKQNKAAETNRNTRESTKTVKVDTKINEVSIDWKDVSDFMDFVFFFIMFILQFILSCVYIVDTINDS